jgi:DNA-directed RNA polymerase specialized sigma24 family protein
MEQSVENGAQRAPDRSDGNGELVRAFVERKPGAAERLHDLLVESGRVAAQRFLSLTDGEFQDVVSESVEVSLEYIRNLGGFEGDIVAFTITVVRNRCRNILRYRRYRPHLPIEPMADYLAAPERSPLDMLEEEEMRGVLQAALGRLAGICRLLLHAFYIQQLPMKEILRLVPSIRTVQGLYHRRAACLKQALDVVQDRLERA